MGHKVILLAHTLSGVGTLTIRTSVGNWIYACEGPGTGTNRPELLLLSVKGNWDTGQSTVGESLHQDRVTQLDIRARGSSMKNLLSTASNR